MDAQELYDKICRVLTWHEHPEEDPFNGENLTEEMYDTLVDVQNWMEESIDTIYEAKVNKYNK